MATPRTAEDCKKALCRLAIKHGVPPKLISERLLSVEDKEDMLQGLITFETLDCAVMLWKRYGMCDYANGNTAYYEHFGKYRAIQGGAEGDRGVAA